MADCDRVLGLSQLYAFKTAYIANSIGYAFEQCSMQNQPYILCSKLCSLNNYVAQAYMESAKQDLSAYQITHIQ